MEKSDALWGKKFYNVCVVKSNYCTNIILPYALPNDCPLDKANKNVALKSSAVFMCVTGNVRTLPQAPTCGKHLVCLGFLTKQL